PPSFWRMSLAPNCAFYAAPCYSSIKIAICLCRLASLRTFSATTVSTAKLRVFGAIRNTGLTLDEELDDDMHSKTIHDIDEYQAILAKLQTSTTALDLAQAPEGQHHSYSGAPRSPQPRYKPSSEWPQSRGSLRPDAIGRRKKTILALAD
ncbi:unnamed protein product, partial [Peniophora sp. CBMAI 1063]